MIDQLDRRILAELERDGRLTALELAERVALSASQCARRRQRLEADDVITGYKAIVDPHALGRAVEAFIQVIMAAHSADLAQDFRRLIARTPEIADSWVLTGDTDYLLRVAVRDLAALNRLVQDVLLPHAAIARVDTRIVLDRAGAGN